MNWYRDQKKAEAAARRDALAEMIASGSTLGHAAKVLGVSSQRVSQLWKRICEDLGETVR